LRNEGCWKIYSAATLRTGRGEKSQKGWEVVEPIGTDVEGTRERDNPRSKEEEL
jgi:hypothetical protein